MIAELLAVAPVIVVLLAISGVFSAAETSLTGASRGRMHQLERDGDRAAARVNRLIGEREQMIGAVLLGNNLINILASAIVTMVLSQTFHGGLGVAIATGIMTVLVLVFAEVLPKTLAIMRADDVARWLSGPTELAVLLFTPVVNTVQWFVGGTLKLVGVDVEAGRGETEAHEEIRGAVEYHHAEGMVESADRRMLGAVLDLGDIIGVLHARDLLGAVAAAEGGVGAIDIAGLAREPWFIPETTKLKDQMNAFRRRRTHFALVVDEYGALQGLVTLEDIIEEIVGEIEDEHDLVAEGVRRQPDGSVIVEGAVTIRELNRAMDWDLPDEEAVTLAGLVIHEAQAIPEVGQTFIFHKHRFQVLRRARNQITLLKLSPPLQDAEASN
jgi:Mg2+/Co2+ transporter CorB